jgi:hypothetical protein
MLSILAVELKLHKKDFLLYFIEEKNRLPPEDRVTSELRNVPLTGQGQRKMSFWLETDNN